MIAPTKKIEKPIFDWTLEIITVLCHAFMLIYVLYVFSSLPSTIPIHFGFNGKPDGYGNKFMLLFLELVAIASSSLLFFAPKFPNLINFPIEITPASEEAQFKNVFLMTRVINLIATLLFLSIIWGTVKTSLGISNGLGYSTLIITALLLISISVFTFRGYLIKKKLG